MRECNFESRRIIVEKDGIIRPAHPVFLKRGIDFHGTRMLTMKY